ncbi:MAG: glucokinase [Hydrogenophaga sp.]|uniref:glucokinase n=1 Tax=Hydrogenophaga sp. TaxID=1904254 RepID=UPI001D51D743|nr:glucokinase [Hydrogenophaga sp.]MBX3611140.1 glucokinase [Hydrogenophaga sp.]
MTTTHSHGGRLLADIGGTHARFAYQCAAGGPLASVVVWPVTRFPSLLDALRHYVDSLAPQRVAMAAIAIANPVVDDAVHMTNHDWSFSQRELREALGLRQLCVVNDFTALALALPTLPEAHRRQVGGSTPVEGAAIGLIGAGTGLGVSGLLPDGRGGWLPLAGEGGHVTWPAITPRERLVFDGLVRRHGHASAERVCSGSGLLGTFGLLCEADRVTHDITTAAAVSDAALSHAHPQALEALALFCGVLGAVAGNLALTLGARGGVYIGGGIVPRLGNWFDGSPFRERFEAKGRFGDYLRPIPVWVITAPESPALQGVASLLDSLD